MTKEKFFSLLRTLLTLGGALLLGHNLFGDPVNEVLWQTITGIAMGIAGVIWGIVDKTLTIEMWQSVLREVITFIMGILLAKGLVSNQTFLAIIAALGSLLPYAQGRLAKRKSRKIASGEISVTQLKK